MSTLSLISKIQMASPKHVRITLALTVVLIFALSLGTLLLSRNAELFAAWWPAAGVSFLAVLIVRGNRVGITLAIWAAATASRLAVGQALAPAVAFGFANALEAWIVATIFDKHTGPAPLRLEDVRSVGRFVFAVVAGALTVGALAALVVAFQGGDGLETFILVTPAHASATLVIAPCLLVAPVRIPKRHRAELVLQAGALAVVLSIVFLPGQTSQLRFLTLPVLIWAALRFAAQVAAVEMLATALAASLLTGLEEMFADRADALSAAESFAIVQWYFIVYAASLLVIGAGRTERNRLGDEIKAREHLLRGGIVGSQIGLLLLREDPHGAITIIDGNDVAVRLLGVRFDAPPRVSVVPPQGQLADTIRAVRGTQAEGEDWSGEVEIDSAGRRLQVFIARVQSASDETLLTLQVIDMSTRYAQQQAVAVALQNAQSTTVQLRELNRQKEDFVSSVSHELRTPIMSILGFSEELADTGLSPLASDYLSVITRNAHRLADLVEDLLEMSRMSDQKSRAQRPSEVMPLNEIISNCIVDLGTVARSNGITLDYVVPDEDVQVSGNSRDLCRVVTNLVSNAVKFTPRGGAVKVICSRLEESVLVDVVDNGIGIPPDEIDRVLERFYRSSTSVSLPGTGLGLSIVTGLVEQLGGTFTLSSDGLTGTQVRVTLPAAVPTAAPVADSGDHPPASVATAANRAEPDPSVRIS